MFRRIEGASGGHSITLQVDDRIIEAVAGDSLALAMLAAGVTPMRYTPVSGAPRAPLCLMGVCFDCLVEVDGQQNVQACMVPARAGMKVRRPTGARRAEGLE